MLDVILDGQRARIIQPAELGSGTRSHQTRIFVVDDDELFCRHLRRLGAKMGLQVCCFDPHADFAKLPYDGDFDVAVVDYDLGHLKGTQVSALYYDTPVLLVSGTKRADHADDAWPSSVGGFLSKAKGARAILEAAVALGDQR